VKVLRAIGRLLIGVWHLFYPVLEKDEAPTDENWKG
jgi:hypothetical protein